MNETKAITPGAAVEPELLSVGDVAKLLSCSARHVYRQSDAGRMPNCRKIGALNRWSRAELLAWIQNGCLPVRHIKGGAR